MSKEFCNLLHYTSHYGEMISIESVIEDSFLNFTHHGNVIIEWRLVAHALEDYFIRVFGPVQVKLSKL